MRSRVADRGVVPLMAAKATSRPEGRPRLEGISGEEARDRTQSWTILPANLARVNEAAKRSRQARFTTVLHHVDVGALASDLQQLVNDIHGLNRKPPLGQAPQAAAAPRTGYSPAATAVAGLFVASALHGSFADPQLTVDQITEKTGLTEEDVTDVLHELRHHVKVSFKRVLPKETLYAEFDQHWQPWNPAEDALTLAADMVNDAEFPVSPAEIAARYDWSARRLNPAMVYLRERDAARLLDALGSGPYVTVRITKTDATRRFVKSRV